MDGTVKWFDSKKGYGFITPTKGKDVFVHYSAIADDNKYRELHEGDKVTFEITESHKGQQASNVVLVQ